MCSSRGSTIDSSGNAPDNMAWGCSRRSNWSGFNIAAMVVGFIFFWPIGLFLLYWIMTGREVQTLPAAIRHQWQALTGRGKWAGPGASDNSVFNAFQQTQHDRINEIREEIKERARRFGQFRDDAQHRADRKEFDEFMASSPIREGTDQAGN